MIVISSDEYMPFSQSSHHVRIVRDAQRPSEVPISLRRHRIDALRRPPAVPAVLQIAAAAACPPADRALAPVCAQDLPSGGHVPRACLRHRGGPGADREHPVLAAQRPHPAALGAGRLPASRYLADVPVALPARAPAERAGGAQSLPGGALPALRPALRRRGGRRYDSPAYLRPPRRGGPWLHPQAASYPALLRPDPLQRGPDRALAGR